MKMVRFFLGLDVGKSEIVATLMDDEEKELFRGAFKNQLSGFREMMKAVTGLTLNLAKEYQIYAGMEATGTYYLKLVKFLYEKVDGVTPYVINPNKVKNTWSTGEAEPRQTCRIQGSLPCASGTELKMVYSGPGSLPVKSTRS